MVYNILLRREFNCNCALPELCRPKTAVKADIPRLSPFSTLVESSIADKSCSELYVEGCYV
jgi:hypothetical protein